MQWLILFKKSVTDLISANFNPLYRSIQTEKGTLNANMQIGEESTVNILMTKLMYFNYVSV